MFWTTPHITENTTASLRWGSGPLLPFPPLSQPSDLAMVSALSGVDWKPSLRAAVRVLLCALRFASRVLQASDLALCASVSSSVTWSLYGIAFPAPDCQGLSFCVERSRIVAGS